MSNPVFTQLTVAQSFGAQPAVCIADWANAAGGYVSDSGLFGEPASFGLTVEGAIKLQLDSSGVTVSALGILAPYDQPAAAQVLLRDASNGQIGIMGPPASDGLALTGGTNGSLAWSTVIPGPHPHYMSSGQLVFDADLTPNIDNLWALGTPAKRWAGLEVYGLEVQAGFTNLNAAQAITANVGDLLWQNRTNGRLSTIASPVSGGDKILKWVNGQIGWGDEQTGGTGGIPEAPSDGLIYGRRNGTWAQVLQPTWSVSQISFNAHVIPDVDGSRDLGSSSNRWDILHIRSISLGGLDLQTTLNGKSNVGHTHTFAELTERPTTKAGFGITDVPTYDETIAAINSAFPKPTDPDHAGGAFVANDLAVFKVNIGWVHFPAQTPAAWGSITGTLANQTDLWNALGAKVEGTGTAARIATWTASATLGNSNLPNPPVDALARLYAYRAPTSIGPGAWESFTPGGGGLAPPTGNAGEAFVYVIGSGWQRLVGSGDVVLES